MAQMTRKQEPSLGYIRKNVQDLGWYTYILYDHLGISILALYVHAMLRTHLPSTTQFKKTTVGQIASSLEEIASTQTHVLMQV